MPSRAHEVKEPIFSTVWGGGGWINGNSVGLDHEECILGCLSAWLMRIRLIIELSTPKLGGWVPEVPSRAHEVKNPIFGTVWGGGGVGWINGNSVSLDPKKRILGCRSAWLMRISLIIEFSTTKLGGVGT